MNWGRIPMTHLSFISTSIICLLFHFNLNSQIHTYHLAFRNTVYLNTFPDAVDFVDLFTCSTLSDQLGGKVQTRQLGRQITCAYTHKHAYRLLKMCWVEDRFYTEVHYRKLCWSSVGILVFGSLSE